jgi:ATP-dependent Zn protease
MTARSEEERRRVAFHEGGHVAVALLMRKPISLASIRPTRGWKGVVYSKRFAIAETDYELEKLARPTPLQPAQLRREIETDIMQSLAGRIAEELQGSFTNGYAHDSDDVAAASLAELNLTSRQRELLARGDVEPGSLETDGERATALAYALAGEGKVYAYLAWLRAETRDLIYSPRGTRLVTAIAEALLERETLSGAQCRTIFRDIDSGSWLPCLLGHQ